MKPIFLKRTKTTLPNSDVSKRQLPVAKCLQSTSMIYCLIDFSTDEVLRFLIGQGLDGKAHGAPKINQDIVNIDASPHISYLRLGVASLQLALLRTRANDSMSDFNRFSV